MLSGVRTLGFKGIEGFGVLVEVDISAGLPAYNIVGLPDTGIKEARDRVTAAIRNSGFDLPNKKIIVNLAPAEIKKAGTHYDLPMAVGILVAGGSVRPARDMSKIAFLGELALDGKLRGVVGLLPMLISIKERGTGEVVVIPEENESEAELAGVDFLKAVDLRSVADFLSGEAKLSSVRSRGAKRGEKARGMDFSEVKGQVFAKRAMEIAAAGFHNMILIGPPGTGKSMLSKRMHTILPPMTETEILETTKIYSVWGGFRGAVVDRRPFREPHHTISDVALIGGGSNPRPGEISLAHNGVLFLDEFPEFSRSAVETLREPLENRKITVSRVKESVTYPASFMLIAAANPCPCGYYGHPSRQCSCAPFQIQKYRNKISGPVLDRIDLHVQVSPVKYAEWMDASGSEESSESIYARVEAARARQAERLGQYNVKYNSMMGASEIRKFCRLPAETASLLENAMDRLGFSARSLDRIVKLSRTIADLEGSEEIKKNHLTEAVQYRVLDRNLTLA